MPNSPMSAIATGRGLHYFTPRTLRHPHVVGAIIVCAVCCNSDERCLRTPQRRA